MKRRGLLCLMTALVFLTTACASQSAAPDQDAKAVLTAELDELASGLNSRS